MRELERTGWMHNRVRMVVASFLTKHLLVPWTDGAAWFMDRLVDADVANNTMGWQWAAGCGADAQPFFRIFNPMLQGKRFDPEGRYVRRWLPELESVPDRHVHAPWSAPGHAARMPIVDHADARDRALDAWQVVRHR
jgi:deoxyribodipyrimidine photo-lyase